MGEEKKEKRKQKKKERDPPSAVDGLEGIDNRVGSWGKKKQIKESKKKVKKQKQKRKCGCKSIGIKANPTHVKEVDGERLFESH